MRKNCSSDQEKLLKFEAEGREFAQFLRSVKGQNNCSWRFLRSNELEQLKFKLENIIGIKNMHEKLEKAFHM